MMINLTIYWMSTLFMLAIIVLFMGDLCSWVNVDRRHLIYLCLVYLLLSVITSIVPTPIILNPFLSYVGNFILLLAFKTSYKNKFLYALMITVICAICDAASYYMISLITGSSSMGSVSYLGTVLLILVIERLANIVIKDKYTGELFSGQGLVLIIIPISSLILLYTCLREQIYSVNLSIVSICILIINAAVVYVFRIISQNHLQALHIAEMEGRIDAFKQEYEIVIQKQQYINTLEHDMHHHIIELMGRTNKGDITAIRSYLESMQSYMDEHDSCNISGNFTADSLVDYWITKAEEQSLTIDAIVDIPCDLPINGAILNLILGNLLENAVEAAQRSVDRTIELKLMYINSNIYIRISNGYNSSHSRDFKTTTKKNHPEKHGLGRNSVEQILTRLNAVRTTDIKDNRFTEEILIPVERISEIQTPSS